METDVMNPAGQQEYLAVHGRVRIVEGGAPELLQRLAHRYLGQEVSFPPMENPPAGYVTHFVPQHYGGIGPWAGWRAE